MAAAKLTDAVKAKMRAAILKNPHLFSARYNKDYLTIGIEIAPQFKEFVQRVHMTHSDGSKAHADMVPIEVVQAAMQHDAGN